LGTVVLDLWYGFGKTGEMEGNDVFKATNHHLEEWLAGYVLLGLLPQEDGTVTRVVIVNGNNNDKTTLKILTPALLAAAAWKNNALDVQEL